VRVNLIHSILVFGEKNIVHIIVRVNLIHFKLVFFLKKMLKNLTHWREKEKKKKPWTVQENCTVHVNSANTVQVNWTVHCEQCNSLALFSEQWN